MTKVGFIGWRGMVGSVLLDRMRTENDFTNFEPVFASTSQTGLKGPQIGMETPLLQDAYNLKILKDMDVIVTCQGSDYTKKMHGPLRATGWQGYWIDAASALRMQDDSLIILDPVNRNVIDQGLEKGIKNFIGGNCTVSLMLMALSGLFQQNCIEWVTSMTYQAASGAGAKNMRELISQMDFISDHARDLLNDPGSSALELDTCVLETMQTDGFPTQHFGVPLAGSVIPWIDVPAENGQSREEWKGYAETNKILQPPEQIPIDGICVRIGAMRCHCQALTIKLTHDMEIDVITSMLKNANEWVKVVPNTKDASIRELSPAAVTGTLSIATGRIRKLNMGPQFLTLFTVGDQLLWGAAEPIRRMLKIVLDYINSKVC